MGGPVLLESGVSRVGHSPSPYCASLGQAVGACCPFSLGAEDLGVRTRHQPQGTAYAPESWPCAPGGRHEGTRGGGVPRAWVKVIRDWALSLPPPPLPEAGVRRPLPVFRGLRGCGRGDPSPTLQHALLRASFARCGGGTRAPCAGRLVPP